ncbi:HAD-like domain-containing protein [Xylaria arbuscula]|nr:HAD-like domain-containing protein [Xylaria arbuscula]
MHQPKESLVKKRYLVSCQCSGSNLLIKILAESSECAVTSREVIRSATSDKASFGNSLSGPRNLANSEIEEITIGEGKVFLIYKHEIGDDSITNASTSWPSPTPPEIAAAAPVFLVRDPIRVFDSWKKRGCTDLKRLIDCFSDLFGLMKDGDANLAPCALYEQLVHQPRREIEQIYSYWGAPYRDFKIVLPVPCEQSSLRGDAAAEDAPGESQTLRSLIVEDTPCYGLLLNSEKDRIEASIGRLYLNCWKNHARRLSDVLSDKQWIGFDLDDTLHEFRRASSAATHDALEVMSERYGLQCATLEGQYKEVLRRSTAHAFSDGKSSSQYRRDRFIAVADHFSLPLKHDNQFLTELLTLYETILRETLELKCGAMDLLRAIKGQGKKISVITEGPQDAQEWTINNLGISPYVDFLATTNHFKLSKAAGLFSRVLDELGISPSEIAYVGDSELRDMTPATELGIFCFHFAEDKNCNLERYPPRINTLNKLEHILWDQKERAT